MAKVPGWYLDSWARRYERCLLIAVPEGQTLVSEARTVHPPSVPMSGGAEPAGAAKSFCIPSSARIQCMAVAWHMHAWFLQRGGFVG